MRQAWESEMAIGSGFSLLHMSAEKMQHPLSGQACDEKNRLRFSPMSVRGEVVLDNSLSIAILLLSLLDRRFPT